MSFKKRKLFFYLLLLVFIIVGSSTVLYSQGYRFDRKDIAIRKVGGIFVRSTPRDASILLDQSPVKNKTWLLQSGTLINNLLPGTYTLELQENGYRPWKKMLAVKPSLVTEADAVVLLKDKPATLLASSTNAFYLAGEFLVTKNLKGELASQDKNLNGDTFIEMSSNNNLAITQNSQTGIYFLNDLKEKSATNLSLLFKNLRERYLSQTSTAAIKYINFFPGDSTRVFIGTDKAAYLLDLAKNSLSLIDNSGITYWNLNSNGLIWQNRKNEAWYYDLSLRTLNQIDAPTSSTVKIDAHGWPVKSNFAMLGKDGILSLAIDSKVEKIADKTNIFNFSPDGQKICFIDKDGTINIQYLNKEKKSSFILREAGGIESFKWYQDSMHLILKYRNGDIYFTEIDGLEPINSYLIEKSVTDYDYDSGKDVLYMLKGKDLMSFDF